MFLSKRQCSLAVHVLVQSRLDYLFILGEQDQLAKGLAVPGGILLLQIELGHIITINRKASSWEFGTSGKLSQVS